MRNNLRSPLFALAAAAVMMLPACEDETSKIGASLDENEVTILVDSTFNVTGKTVEYTDFDPRNSVSLLGRINVPEYGDLRCSFMAQMLSASQLNVPDSIDVERVDSMKLTLKVPRGSLTGDSLAPQQMRVYRLAKPIEANHDGKYNPAEYYNPADLLGSKSFTISALSQNDSLFNKAKYIDISIPLKKDFARQVFTDYRTNPSIFAWPSSFVKYFPGIFVESSFGAGCIANVSKAQATIYYYRLKEVSVKVDSVTYKTDVRHQKDSTTVFATAPEVISVNNIDLNIADNIRSRVAAGENILLTPAGYNIDMRFPLPEIIEKYTQGVNAMTVIDNLTFSIPASTIDNDFGITVPPNLLMVPTSKLNEFFAENKIPDGETSFWATYSSATGEYTFDSMRNYFRYAIEHPEEVTEDYYNFTLVPVDLEIQYKYVGYNQTEPIVVGCTPYVTHPTMARVHLDRAKVRFTYSRQEIY